MNQIDFFGAPAVVQRPFKDIRNTRPTVAEEKARLVLELGRLCAVCPQSVRNGSVNLTRQWVAAQEKGRKLAANSRASVVELGLSIKALRTFE